MSRLDVIQRIFEDAEDSLGTIERNTEVKVVFLVLWELGWDPVHEIALCFHIPRSRVRPPAKAAVAADLALRDELGLCGIGEVKQWCYKKDWANAERQISRYRDALEVPLAFVTRGRRWTVWECDKRHDFDNPSAPALIQELRAVLGRRCVNVARRPDADKVWRFGLNPRDRWNTEPASNAKAAPGRTSTPRTTRASVEGGTSRLATHG